MPRPAAPAALAPRDPDTADTPTAILDAAERLFAEAGFHGATTRAIAEAAGANPALIHYHFGSKEALYEAAFARRSDAINGERRHRLAALEAAGAATLEAVLTALLEPTIALGRDPARGGAHYARLLAHVAAGTDERSRRLTADRYDGIARLYIAAIARAVPGLAPADAVRGYLNAISIGMALMAPTGRDRALSDGAIGEEPVAALVARAVRFAAAGIRALAAPDHDHRHPGKGG